MSSGSPPSGGSSKTSRRNWFEKKDKEEKRSKSFRRLRSKKSDDITAPPPQKTNEVNGHPHREESKSDMTETKSGSSINVPLSEETDELSEGDNEEDIRGEFDISTRVPTIATVGAPQEDSETSADKKTNATDDNSTPCDEAKSSEGKTDLVESEEKESNENQRPELKRVLAQSQERRPSIAKSMKMAMEEELLSRVKEKPNHVALRPNSSSGAFAPVEEDEEEEEELIFSESNEALIIQLGATQAEVDLH